MSRKYPVKYIIKGHKKGGVCVIFVKNVKEDQLLSIIRRAIEFIIGRLATIVLKILKQPGTHGQDQDIKRKCPVIVVDSQDKT
jgi:hypothetical protein